MGAGQLQFNRDLCSDPLLALKADLAAHQFHQLPANAQPQTGAAIFGCGIATGLRKRLEQQALLLRTDADTAVLDADLQARPVLISTRRADTHKHPAFAGELQGVAEQVVQHLTQTHRIKPVFTLGRLGELQPQLKALL